MKLTLGFSPCPNDTFIFDAMVNGHIDTRGLSFDVMMEDVETLNAWALEGRLDITKLSFSTFLKVSEPYALLHSGSALGRGVGPLLIARSLPQGDLAEWIASASIAIPGLNTTANLLLSLAFPAAKNKTELLFSEIEEAVLSGKFDAGLIIHESRFTYQSKGLIKLMDMGDWWEQYTAVPIPLGGIVIKRSLSDNLAATVDTVIRESLAWSWSGYPNLSDFVKTHAQEMEESVMRSHIELYVNQFTSELGAEGEKAIQQLFEGARRAGLIPSQTSFSVFY